MKIKRLTEKTIAQIKDSVSSPLSDSDITALSRIIEGALVDAVVHSTKSCSSAAVTACGPESDLAHKIAQEVKLAQNALIENLKSMR